ncbi:MAG: hypothetical protein EWV58_05885 [Microcystis aeruginosa Ma_MB_F_20061100_S19]|nr:MAG: hypothetical protein EWV58_05885 [Microcystis aeruginosa Ma_MB_F_20061100_S19]
MSAPLSDSIIAALAKLIDDSKTERRDPSHSDLEFHIKKAGLSDVDPIKQGQTIGKAKRIRAVLNWCIEQDVNKGGKLIDYLIAALKGYGSFRSNSPNYVGAEAITNCAAAFRTEGYELTLSGELHPLVLSTLSGANLTFALNAYVRRAKQGSEDAALLVGTSKDLLEAVAGHILQSRYGSYSSSSNFPALLGQAFTAIGLPTDATPSVPGESPQDRLDRALFTTACAVNNLRNKQGSGHGRPWLPTVSNQEAIIAIELMGVIAERMLEAHRIKP